MPKARQTVIPGTVDEAPAEVASAAAKYLEEKRALGAIREKMNASLDILIAAMHEADIEEILIDEGAKKLILAAEDKIKIKARKKDKQSGEWIEEDE